LIGKFILKVNEVQLLMILIGDELRIESLKATPDLNYNKALMLKALDLL